tara:strand:+ start:383 stop:1474 length:1092 start_codon:yes stop_codon:yes gene_type:complete
MTTLSTITAGEILTVYMITDDLQVPDDYDYCEKVKASLLLKGYYCTKIDYEQHIEFLVDSDILGRGQFGKVYFAMSDNNPNKSDIDIAIIIYEKLKTFTNSITHHHPPYPTPPQSPEEIYANGKIWESGDDEVDSDCDSDCEIVSNISIIDDNHEGESINIIDDNPEGESINIIDDISYEGLPSTPIFDDNPEGESINSIIDDDTQQSSKNVFFVKSFSTPNRKYVVSIQPDGDLNCSCPHNQYTNSYCKHMNHLYISYYTDSDNIKNPTLYNALVKKQEYSDNKIVHKPPSTPGILQSSKYYVKDYIITVDSNTTTCTCCDFKYRGPNRFCKHMAFIYPDISSFSKHLIDNFYHSCGDNVYE